MRVYLLFTPSHRQLFDEWFSPTFRQQMEIVMCEKPQHGEISSHVFGTPEFNSTTREKITLWLEAAKENWGKPFLYADVDMQFFGDIKGMVFKALRRRHVVFQRAPAQPFYGASTLHANTGFVAAIGCDPVVRLFEEALQSDGGNDQNAINRILLGFDRLESGTRSTSVAESVIFRTRRSWAILQHQLGNGPYGLKWGLFPAKYVIGGDQAASPPATTLVHHATQTVGVAAKHRQLLQVRRQLGDGQVVQG